MKITREYRQTARAEAVAATRRRVMDAFFTLSETRLFTDISLADVAARAQVSVQTVLRHFGSRTGLFEATFAYAAGIVAAERRRDVNDVASGLTALVDHYERRGAMVLMMLAQESSDPMIGRVVRAGRDEHRDWVRTVFAEHVTSEAEVDLLVVATDVYTWKLLRHDRGLSRRQTRDRMRALIDALT